MQHAKFVSIPNARLLSPSSWTAQGHFPTLLSSFRFLKSFYSIFRPFPRACRRLATARQCRTCGLRSEARRGRQRACRGPKWSPVLPRKCLRTCRSPTVSRCEENKRRRHRKRMKTRTECTRSSSEHAHLFARSSLLMFHSISIQTPPPLPRLRRARSDSRHPPAAAAARPP